MNNRNIYETFDNFNADDYVDSRLIDTLTDNNPLLSKRIRNDFNNVHIKNLSYKKLINFYNQNQNFDVNNVALTRDGVLLEINNILNEIEYIVPDEELNYFKNLAEMLTLKHLLNAVERTKSAIHNKINKFKQEIFSESNKKFVYNIQLRRNVNDLYHEEDLFNISRAKVRPESATPSYVKVQNSYNNTQNDEKNLMSFSFNKPKLDESTLSPRFINEYSNTTGNSEFNQKMNINLTSCVWPKSRTLLSIISKMFLERYINSEQRSTLKEMVIDRDTSLTKHLNEYEVTGDSLKMYQKIIESSLNRLQMLN